jgi:hypothetical protein
MMFIFKETLFPSYFLQPKSTQKAFDFVKAILNLRTNPRFQTVAKITPLAQARPTAILQLLLHKIKVLTRMFFLK